MFLYGLSSLVFWMLLVMAVFAVMRWSAWGGRRPHPLSGLRGAGTLRPAGLAPGLGPVTAEQILAERFARGEIDEDESGSG